MATLAHGGQLGVVQPGRAGHRLVGVPLEVGPPMRRDDEDRDLAAPVVEPGVIAHRRAERLQGRPEPRLQQEGVERALEASVLVDQPEQLRALGPAAPGDRVV